MAFLELLKLIECRNNDDDDDDELGLKEDEEGEAQILWCVGE